MKKIAFPFILLLCFLSLSTEPVFAATPTLSDFWQGKDVWKPVFTIQATTPGWASGFPASGQVVVVGSDWYLITRHVDWNTPPESREVTLAISKSVNNGQSWTVPIDILANTPGTPQGELALDGGTFYNASTNTWHILYQCLADVNSAWKGCHATRAGADPMGPFTPDPNNPVINGGDLWNKICNSPTDKCVTQATGHMGHIVDEGTFDIFQFDGTYYWITFHGFDGINGFRGMAKTKDFHTFIAGDTSQGLSTDAFFNPSDLVSWNVPWIGAPIGFGDSRTIKEGNYYYQIASGADVDLGATIGNHWGYGIFRSDSLASTTWQQPTAFRNPIIQTNPVLQQTDSAAAPGYSGLFRDSSGKLYFHTSQTGYSPSNSGIFFFSLFNPADIDQNGKVDINDYNKMIGDFGKTGVPANLSNVPFVPSDINNDGKVDIFDYNNLVTNYGK